MNNYLNINKLIGGGQRQALDNEDFEAKSLCCGCAACAQRCPKHSITMEEDGEGFLYPKIDTTTCIDCGLCEKVCPIINGGTPSTPLKVYAAKNKDREKRELSSSGGLFIALAEQVIADGGVVFGVVFDEKWEAHHVAATTIEEVLPMMRSKYVQSRTENTYKEAEQYLKQGRRVMYTGTSCQIAGLKRFLRKEYDNLIAVDVICHGVPSPGVWRRYLEEEINKSARSAATGKNTVLNRSLKPMSVIADISFREKSRSGFDWQKYGFVVWQKSADKGGQNSVLSSYTFGKEPYSQAFVNNLIFRPSCESCPAKGGTSGSDLTIADFWGIETVLPDFIDKSGVSLAVIHTRKGMTAFKFCDLDFVETTIEKATRNNMSYYKSLTPHKKRSYFFKAYQFGVGTAIQISMYVPLIVRAKRKTVRIVKRVLRHILPKSTIEKVKKVIKIIKSL